MDVIGKHVLDSFTKRHGNSRKPLDRWLNLMEKTNYPHLIALRRSFRNPDDVGENNIIFNIGGNKYRLHALIDFEDNIVQIIKIGTHAEYNNWQF